MSDSLLLNLDFDTLNLILSLLPLKCLYNLKKVTPKLKIILNKVWYNKYRQYYPTISYFDKEDYYRLFMAEYFYKFINFIKLKIYPVDNNKRSRAERIKILNECFLYINKNQEMLDYFKCKKFKVACYDKLLEIYEDNSKKVKKMASYFMKKIFNKNIKKCKITNI